MKKRIFLRLLAFAVTLVVFVNAVAVSAFALSNNEWEYSVISEEEKTVKLTDYLGASAIVDIPETVDGYTVKAYSSTLFLGNTAVKEVTVPDGIEEIGASCFYNCSSLEKVTLPKSVSFIQTSAFFGCSSLKEIKISLLNLSYSSKDGVLYDRLKTKLLLYPAGKTDASFTVPRTVEKIENRAFRNCSNLKTVVLGEKTTEIGSGAFQNCTSLTDVSLINGIKRIADSAFSGCSSLNGMVLPQGLVEIGELAFSDCKSLESITIPEGVTDICKYAFSGCTALNSIMLPSTLTSIGASAFENTGWYNSQENGVLYLGDYLICYKETVILPDVPEGSYDGPVANGENSNCENVSENEIDAQSAESVDYSARITTFSVVVPDGIRLIADNAFYYIDELDSITMPESVLYIGSNAFTECTQLVKVNMSDNVISIGESAFSGCMFLSTIRLSKGLTEISDYMFANCVFLKSIEIPASVTRIGYRAFYNCKRLVKLTLPDGLLRIADSAFFGCEKLVNATIPKSVQSIENYAFSNTGWYSAQPDGILYLDGCVLGVKGALNETNVNIADGTRLIAEHAFFRSDSITDITIPSSVQYIGKDAFYGTGWYSAQPSGLVILDGCLLDVKGEITDEKVILPNDVRVIAVEALQGCKNVESFTLPEATAFVNDGAFKECTALESVKFCNSQCYVSEKAGTIPSDVTLGSYKGSEVEGYAQRLGYKFKPIIGTVSLNSVYSLGDLDDDGEVSLKDRLVLLDIIAGKLEPVGTAIQAADLNKDGKIDTGDIEVLVLVIVNARGDINEDGNVDLQDYALSREAVVERVTLSSAQFIIADINKDNAVDAFDIFLIDKIINSLI